MCKLKHIKSWKQLLKLIFTGSYESVYSPLWEVCPPPNSNNNLATEQKWFFPVCLQFNILLEVKRIRYCLQLLCSEECLMLVLKNITASAGQSARSSRPSANEERDQITAAPDWSIRCQSEVLYLQFLQFSRVHADLCYVCFFFSYKYMTTDAISYK